MMERDYILKVRDLAARKNGVAIFENISFELAPGEHLMITGPAGSGKSTLGLALAGLTFYNGTIDYSLNEGQTISWIEQQHHFKNLSNTSDFYYQQRFNSTDADEAVTVDQYLVGPTALKKEIIAEMKIDYLLEEPLIQLSNGENKKVQLAKALLTNPAVLIMDQPFVGLDKETRTYLKQLLDRLAALGVTIILITSSTEIPDCVTIVVSLEKEGPGIKDRNEWEKMRASHGRNAAADHDAERIQKLCNGSGNGFDIAIGMRDVNVQYGDRIILKGINWEVKRGERWLLSGPNGAGKSTLLSLVTADNPQAYANDIVLFDKKRGTGETIWDIKKKIGYLSPELHLFFDNSCTTFEAVASGLFDTIGLFRLVPDEQVPLIQAWMELLGVRDITNRRLYELSAGEQRRVLLARALVKNPPLLILDEPCQGLDEDTEMSFINLVNSICLAGDKTLIFVTHYAARRPACIERFIELEKGMIVQKDAVA